MKRFVFALVAALLLAAQVLSPAAAAPTAATCGDTYVVQRGDYLSKIARYCGVSLSTLITANPEIKNINLLYVGQVIRTKVDGSIPVTGTKTYVVQYGDTLFKIAVRYGTTVAELMRLNPQITDAWRIFAGQVIYIPGSGTVVSGARVTLSASTAKPNTAVTVYVAGFPASAEIDYRLGKQGAAYSVVVDGKTDASGATSASITIPSTAVAGEKWVVTVLTTSLAKGTSVVSPVITIQ